MQAILATHGFAPNWPELRTCSCTWAAAAVGSAVAIGAMGTAVALRGSRMPIALQQAATAAALPPKSGHAHAVALTAPSDAEKRPTVLYLFAQPSCCCDF